MALVLLEGAVTAIDTYIKANIAAKVAALNTEYGDTLLTVFKAYYLGNVPDEIPEYPSLCYQGDNWAPEKQTKYNLEVADNIILWVYVGDQDAAIRFKKLCRYARALVELLNTGEASYGYSHYLSGKIQLTDTIRSPSFLQAIQIPIIVKKGESY